MTAETDITAIDDGGANTAAEVRSALTSVLARADTDPFLTTKGDLLTHTTGPARLGVGTDGQALVADSTVAAGVKWGDVGGGFFVWPMQKPLTGHYLPAFYGGALRSNSTMTANRVSYVPFVVSWDIATSNLAVRPAGNQNDDIRVGIYSSDNNGAPGTLLAAGEHTAVWTLNVEADIALSSAVAIEPGTVYWLAMVSNSAGNFDLYSHGIASDGRYQLAPTPPTTVANAYNFSGNNMLVYYETITYASGLPATAAATLQTAATFAHGPVVKVD